MDYRGLDFGGGLQNLASVLEQGYRDRAALQRDQDNQARQIMAAQMQDARQREMQQELFKQQSMLQDRKAAYDLEAAKIAAGTKQGQKDISNTQDLRKEFNAIPVVKQFPEIQRSFSGITDAVKGDTPASDMRAIFLLMKMYDPNSTVREGEYATAEQARSVPAGVLNAYNKLTKGTKLTPEQRQDFLAQAAGMYKNAAGQYQDYRNQYQGLAQKIGIDPELAVPNMDFISRSGAGSMESKAAPSPSSSRAAAAKAFAESKIKAGANPEEVNAWLQKQLGAK